MQELDQDTDRDAMGRTHNFWVLALFQIALRIGWIFKTESIIIPAVLDSLGGSAGLRGFLPFFNRLGQSILPVALAKRLAARPRKRVALSFYAAGMSICFVGISLLWWLSIDDLAWAPYLFLLFYALFFVCKGMMDLAFGSLQGKLVPTTKRGRLLMVSNVIGAIFAVLAAWLLLSRLITPDGGHFELVFGFTAASFAVAAGISMKLIEPADEPVELKAKTNPFADAMRLLRDNGEFRLLCLIALLFGTSMMLFPHYQALGRERLSLSFQSIVAWVIVQNMGTATFSIAIGLVADRFGNRMVLQGTLLGIWLMPLLALYFAAHAEIGVPLYWLVFVLFGLTPVTIRVLTNFALELAKPEEHPKFLSTLLLCIAIPIYFSPLLGMAIDRVSFDLPMLVISGTVGIGWILTFVIAEPRHD